MLYFNCSQKHSLIKINHKLFILVFNTAIRFCTYGIKILIVLNTSLALILSYAWLVLFLASLLGFGCCAALSTATFKLKNALLSGLI